MINFVVPQNQTQHWSSYVDVIYSHMNPVARYVDKYSHGDADKTKLNMCYFTELSTKGRSVLMSHGIADKLYLRKMRTENAKKFKHVLVSGPVYKDYLEEHFKFESVDVVGYPKLDYIFEGKFKKALPTPGKKRVLWMPTHNAIQEVSSFPALQFYFHRFPADIELMVSEHPANRKDNSPTMQKLLDADFVIADAGSSIYEAWDLGKPVVFPDWMVKVGVTRKFKGSLEEEIYEQGLGYHATNFSDLVDIIMAHDKPQQKEMDFMEKVFPSELRGKSGKKAAEVLQLLDKKHFG